MLNITTTQSIATVISLFCAYLISTTLTGSGQAWVAKKMGDDSAADAGFLSLNPLDHLDAIGSMMVVFFGIGWGRQIPIDLYSIQEPYRFWRLFLVFCSESIISLLLALTSLTLLIIKFSRGSFIVALEMFFSGNSPMHLFAQLFPETSSGFIAIALLFVAMIFFNIIIATISLIINMLRFALLIGNDRGYAYAQYADYISLLAPLLILFLLADPLRSILMQIVMASAYLIGHLVGAL